MLIEKLRIVQGALPKKSLVPILSHVKIDKGQIQGSNGFLSVGTPCPELAHISCIVSADKFHQAVRSCGDDPVEIEFSKNKIHIQSGKLKIRLPTGNMEEFPAPPTLQAETAHVMEVDPDHALSLLDSLKRISPFMGEDAFRLWSHGVLVRSGFLWATNNISLVRSPMPWLRKNLDGVVWPSFLVDELLRLNTAPKLYMQTEDHVAFLYEDNTWIVSSVLKGAWPDVEQFFLKGEAAPVIDDATCDRDLIQELRDAVEKVQPFCPDLPVVLLSEQGVATEDGVTSATVELPGLSTGRMRVEPLLLVLHAATSLDLRSNPARWQGPGVEGVLAQLPVRGAA